MYFLAKTKHTAWQHHVLSRLLITRQLIIYFVTEPQNKFNLFCDRTSSRTIRSVAAATDYGAIFTLQSSPTLCSEPRSYPNDTAYQPGSEMKADVARPARDVRAECDRACSTTAVLHEKIFKNTHIKSIVTDLFLRPFHSDLKNVRPLRHTISGVSRIHLTGCFKI
jgi:hypothetical protein